MIELTEEEFKQVQDALWKARCDIWQTARVSEYNLTGKDPNFLNDAPNTIPDTPRLIHRAGLDESYAVFEEVCAALMMLAFKTPAARAKLARLSQGVAEAFESGSISTNPRCTQCQRPVPEVCKCVVPCSTPASAQLFCSHACYEAFLAT